MIPSRMTMPVGMIFCLVAGLTRIGTGPNGHGDPTKSTSNFRDSPRGNVSQDGRFFLFTSNWEETLGKDPRGRPREDVFIVKLEKEEPISKKGNGI